MASESKMNFNTIHQESFYQVSAGFQVKSYFHERHVRALCVAFLPDQFRSFSTSLFKRRM